MYSNNRIFKNINYYQIDKNNILCSYNVILDRIKISSGFFKKLDENEAHFMLAHEEGHKRDRPLFLFFILVNFSFILSFIICLFLSFFIYIDIELLLTLLLFTLISFFLLICFYRYSEYRADIYAARLVDYAYFISALKKFKKENYSILVKILVLITHPCPEKRIKHIKNMIDRYKMGSFQ